MKKDTPRYLVKFGEKEHLKGLVDGNIYFSDAKHYIEIERKEKNRGQGDALEGTTRIAFANARLVSREDPRKEAFFSNQYMDLAYEFVPNMPVFCVTAIHDVDCVDGDDGKVTIKFPNDVREKIEVSFPKADSALLIKTPATFKNDVSAIFNNICVWDFVEYFDDLQNGNLKTEMFEYICGEYTDEKLYEGQYLARATVSPTSPLIQGGTFYITPDNVHRVLFCKDSFFKNQREYRCVAHHGILSQPGCFKYENHSVMELYDIDTFLRGVTTNEATI